MAFCTDKELARVSCVSREGLETVNQLLKTKFQELGIIEPKRLLKSHEKSLLHLYRV